MTQTTPRPADATSYSGAPAPAVVPKRVLLGPGPSEVDPEVLRSLTLPPLGHLDPVLLGLMQEVESMLRGVFNTQNKLTLALSGTGTSGMEAALTNMIEAGDPVVVGVNGYFGDRICQIVQRVGGVLTRVDVEWGTRLDPNKMREAILKARPRVVAVVHAETSTGVYADIEPIAQAAHEVDAVLIADAVTSLGGQPLYVDEWGIDVCYSGSQKCLGAPSGLSPITFGDRALQRLRGRKTPVPSFYLDANLLQGYWDDRQYHHTISAPLIYALHTALRLLHEESLERRWRRHEINHKAFRAGVEALGLSILPDESISLWPLNAVLLPDELDEMAIRGKLLNDEGIEVGGGMGVFKGKLLRVGLMGYGSQRGFVLMLLAALEKILRSMGREVQPGAGLAAAMARYDSEG